MSYGLYIQIIHKDNTNGTETEYELDILKKGYTGDVQQWLATNDVFSHTYPALDPTKIFEESVQNAELTISALIEDADQLGVLEDIFSKDETHYQARLTINGSIEWRGYVLNDLLDYSEDAYPFESTIVAKDLTYTKGIKFPLEDVREPIIHTLARALNELDYGIDIHSFTNWYEKTTATDDDFLNQIYHDTVGFRTYAANGDESDVRITVYEVIDRICKNYNLILRQVNNAWNLIHVSALNNPESVKRYVYDSAGVQQSVSDIDLRQQADGVGLFVLPSSKNRGNPGLKSVAYQYNHRSGITDVIVDNRFIEVNASPAQFIHEYSASGSDFIKIRARCWARTVVDTQDGYDVQGSYLLRSGQYYHNYLYNSWVSFESITNTMMEWNHANELNTVRIYADVCHGDVVRFTDSDDWVDSDKDYYLLKTEYSAVFKLSESYDGSPVTLDSNMSGNGYVRVLNQRFILPQSNTYFNESFKEWDKILEITSENIPSDFEGNIEFILFHAVTKANNTEKTNACEWRGVQASIESAVAFKGDSITYELEQTGNYSAKSKLSTIYFGDGPTNYARSALRTSVDLESITENWRIRNLVTPPDYSFIKTSFQEVKLKEVLNYYRGARKNGDFNLWGNYRAQHVLVHNSLHYFFLGGKRSANNWNAEFVELNIQEGDDVLQTIIKSSSSSSGGGGGGASEVLSSSSSGLSEAAMNAKYLQKAEHLADLENPEEARENLELVIGQHVQAYNPFLDGQDQALKTTDHATFAGATINGSLSVNGDIIQYGNAYETHAQQIYTANDFIISRDGAVAALAPGEISGQKVLKADGINDVVIGVDNQAVARVGWESGTLQAIATREDSPSGSGIAFWDAANYRFATSAARVTNAGDIEIPKTKWLSLNQEPGQFVGVRANGAHLELRSDHLYRFYESASPSSPIFEIDANAAGDTGIGGISDNNYKLRVYGAFKADFVNTGQGNNKLYAMNQHVRTYDRVTFGKINISDSADEMLRLQHSSSTGNPYLSFYQGSTRRGYIQYNDSLNTVRLASEYGHLSLYTGTGGSASERMRISASSGNVLINTTTDSGYKLDVNGTLRATGSSIFNSYVGSPTYTSGILGNGWRIDPNATGGSFLEVDNGRFRNELRAHIFKKDVVKVANGYLYISDAAEIAETVTIVNTSSTFKVKNTGSASFNPGTLLWAKNIQDNGSLDVTGVKIKVGTVHSSGTTNGVAWTRYNITAVENGGTLNAGDTIVRVSGSSILMDASSQYAPFIDIYSGVDTWANFNSPEKSRARIGNLAGKRSAIYGDLATDGIWTNNIYAEGNAQIAGTLTAGDNAGIGQTFVAGRLKVNLMLNSAIGLNNTSHATRTVGTPTNLNCGSAAILGQRNPNVTRVRTYANQRAKARFGLAGSGLKTSELPALDVDYFYSCYVYVPSRFSTPNAGHWYAKQYNTTQNYLGNIIEISENPIDFSLRDQWQRIWVRFKPTQSSHNAGKIYIHLMCEFGTTQIANPDDTHEIFVTGGQLQLAEGLDSPSLYQENYKGSDPTAWAYFNDPYDSSYDEAYGMWASFGGFGGDRYNPVVELGDYGFKILNANNVHTTSLEANSIMIGNVTGSAAGGIKVTNTGTPSTSGIFGYTASNQESFALRLDGTSGISAFEFNEGAMYEKKNNIYTILGDPGKVLGAWSTSWTSGLTVGSSISNRIWMASNGSHYEFAVYKGSQYIVRLGSEANLIAGWTIDSKYLLSPNASFSTSTNDTPIRLSVENSGSGSVYGGGRKLKGLTMSWHRVDNAGHLVFGQMMASATTLKTGYYGIQMMNHLGKEFFALGAKVDVTGSYNTYARIGGFDFNETKLSATGLTIHSGRNAHIALGRNAHIALGSATSLTSGKGVWQDALGKWRVGDPSGSRILWDGANVDIKSNTFNFDTVNLKINSVGTSYPSAYYDSNKDSVTSNNLDFIIVDTDNNSNIVTFGDISVNSSDLEEIIKIHVKYDIDVINDFDFSIELGVWLQGQKVSNNVWENLPIPENFAVNNANLVYRNGSVLLEKETGTNVSVSRFIDRLGVRLAPLDDFSSSTSMDGSYTFYLRKSLVNDYDHYRVRAQVLSDSNIILNNSFIKAGSYMRPYSSIVEINTKGIWVRKADAVYEHNNLLFTDSYLINQ